MTRNPDWTRDELILALDLYFSAGRKQLDPRDLGVQQLSRLLNRLPIHSRELREADFRNPQGVAMKLGNFSAIDPDYHGAGLTQGAKADKAVWGEFASDPSRLHTVAAAIAGAAEQMADMPDEDGAGTDEDDFAEGKLLTRLHKSRERNSRAVKEKKRKVLSETGRLRCEACGFEFEQVYGALGREFAECHHTIPIADLMAGHKTRLADLVIVCSNCHRMIHRSRPMLTVAGLRAIIGAQRRE